MSLAALASLILAAGTPLPAPPGVSPIDARWREVSRARQGDCDLVVTGDGRFFLISATGLGSGAPARFVLTNGDMKPIDWQVRANSSGRFARYHLPFRWHRSGGTVSVSIDSERCALTSSFQWRRAMASAY